MMVRVQLYGWWTFAIGYELVQAVVAAATRQNWRALQFCCEALRADRKFMLKMVILGNMGQKTLLALLPLSRALFLFE
eukprot:3588095-Amphidinium_carterae.1